MTKCRKLLRKLKKYHIKMLRYYALGHMIKARELENKAMILELKLMDQRRLVDEIDEGLDALKEVRCKTHPDAPHGMDRRGSHFEGRYVCECESWEPDHALMLSDEAYQRGKNSLKEKNK